MTDASYDIGSWEEVRFAFEVARLGTVSAAAEKLGVHHATVIRHVDALEARLGVKLFQRHPRGYQPTEAGRELLEAAAIIDARLSALAGRLRGHGDSVEGEVALTTIAGLSGRILPVVAGLCRSYPGLRVRLVADPRPLRLERGEAHVAVRAGPAPEDPDYVVQPLASARIGLYAAVDYAERHGLPENAEALAGHRFVSDSATPAHAPHHRWLAAQVPETSLVLRSGDPASRADAVRAGIGIGFLGVDAAEAEEGLVRVLPEVADFASRLWLVTHVALHRTAKVQAVVQALRRAARGWPGAGEAGS